MRAPSEFVSTRIGNKTAVITLGRPPEGTLTAALRASLLSEVHAACENPGVTAIVLTADNGGFTLDLPLLERQTTEAAPSLAELTEAIATAPKPVVAALRGRVGDAGMEICLAAPARVAHIGTLVSLPALHMGRLPSPAALYTLATRLGPKRTAQFLETLPQTAVTFGEIKPLFDALVAQNAVGEAAELAQALPAQKPQPAFDDPVAYQQELQALRARSNGSAQPADHAALLTALEAAQLLPEDVLRSFILTQDDTLSKTPLSRAKTYRRAAKLATMRSFPEAPVPTALTLVGTGPQAPRITLSALRAGLPVQVIALEPGDYSAFYESIEAQIKLRIAKRQLPVTQADPMLSNLTQAEGMDSLRTADWVVEAAAHSLDTIDALITRINSLTPETTPVMLTSAMRSGAGEFAALFKPRTAGLQFHADIGHGELAELALKPEMARTDRHRAPMLAALRRIGVPAVFQSAQNGLVSARLLTALCIAAEEAVALGSMPDAVDAALSCRVKPFAAQNAEGFRAQPFRISAFFGDIATSPAPSLAAALLKAGVEGGNGTSALASGRLTPEAIAAVTAWQSATGHTAARAPDAKAINELATLALLSAGFALLEDRIVQYPWEIDQIAAATLGFSPSYGGAFFEAEATGLSAMRRKQQALAPLRPEFFNLTDRFDELVKNGLKFAKPGQPGLAYV